MKYDDLIDQQTLERATLIRQAMTLAGWRLGTAAKALGMAQPRLLRLLQRALKTSALGQIWVEYRKTKPRRGRG
ncbi:MAG: hypothetical protein AMJ46_12705 [Latescibacteria bacterium DG_63]|nr:MAG: hypothetical protein AMJ46_12705 [Latescibacteria bacterium DG_63]